MDDEVVILFERGLLDNVSHLDRLKSKLLGYLLELTFMVDIRVLQGRLRVFKHSVQIDRVLRWICRSELVKYAFPLLFAIRFRGRKLRELAELNVSLVEACVLELRFDTCAASFIIRFSFAEVDVSQETPRMTISDANLGSTLPSQRVVECLRVGLNSKRHLASVMLIPISRSESQVVNCFVTTRCANRLKVPIVVHVDLGRLEPLLSMIYSICTPRWAIIELIDIKCIEMFCDMYHFGLFLVTLF